MFVAAATGFIACDAADDGVSYSLTWTRPAADGGPVTFAGEVTSYKVNTSFPTSDPRSGKFFVSVIADQGQGALISTTHFTNFSTPPDPGTYAIPQAATTSGTVTISGGDGPTDVSADSGSFTVSARSGGGIRVDFPTTGPLKGFIDCAP